LTKIFCRGAEGRWGDGKEKIVDESEFWALIDRARRDSVDDPEDLDNVLFRSLLKEPPERVQGFHEVLYSKLSAAYRWDLWGAAYLINGGCSDDGFEYFRAWLISRGQSAYDAAIENPDSLADIASPDDVCEYEAVCYVAWKAYKQITGAPMEPRPRKQSRRPSGENWDFDDKEEMATRFPRLSVMFG
jgi:hypothetical protein